MAKALLVVDMVSGFLEVSVSDKMCNLHLRGARDIISNINREISTLKKDDILVFVCDTHDENDEEFKTWPKHCVRGSGEEKVTYGFISPAGEPTVKTIEKTRFSAFYNTKLESVLYPHNIEEVIVTGVCTDVCVFATALDARYRDYKVTIPRDCVFPLDKARGDYLLEYLRQVCNVTLRGN